MGTDALARALARDPAGADLPPAERAMLDYAIKLTREPHGIGAADVDRLRREGFSDPAVLDICQIVSYYNYVNRLADGLGVELEDEWTDDDLILTRAEFRALRGDRPSDGL